MLLGRFIAILHFVALYRLWQETSANEMTFSPLCRGGKAEFVVIAAVKRISGILPKIAIQELCHASVSVAATVFGHFMSAFNRRYAAVKRRRPNRSNR